MHTMGVRGGAVQGYTCAGHFDPRPHIGLSNGSSNHIISCIYTIIIIITIPSPPFLSHSHLHSPTQVHERTHIHIHAYAHTQYDFEEKSWFEFNKRKISNGDWRMIRKEEKKTTKNKQSIQQSCSYIPI